MRLRALASVIFLFLFLAPLSVSASSEETAENFQTDRANFNSMVYQIFVRGELPVSGSEARAVFNRVTFCTFVDSSGTWGACGDGDPGQSKTSNLQALIDDTIDYDFRSDNDNSNTGEPSGSLDVRFENTPDDPTVGQSPQFKVVGEDSRTGISNDVYLYNNGEVNLTFSPEYEDESSLIAEKTCEPDTPRYCNISINDGDNPFSFLSPGENTLKAMAEDGAGTVVDASVDVNVQLGNPPNEDNLNRFSVEGGFGDSWNPVLNERWEDSLQADEGNERLAFVQDEYDNIVIDTGDSYLYGGAFIQKQSYDQDVDGKKIQVSYRIDVQDDDNENTNRFGVVTVDEDGNFRNSTIGPERFDTKDEEGINQNEKTYTLTHDLSSSTDDIRVGVFFNGDATQGGSGDFGNGMRVIIEDIRIIDEQRDVSFEKRSPNFEENPLVRGQSSSFNFKVNDNFDQLDLAKVNVSSELNRQDAPRSNERESRICEQGSPSFCYSSGPDFTPQKLGGYIFTVGIETKTGKYFSKEFSAVSHAGDQLSLGNIDFNDNGEARFKAEDNFEGGDLSGKNFTAEKLVGSGERRQFRIIESNRCRPDGDSSVCYVPRIAQEFESGTFRLKLLTEEDELLINQTVEQVDIS